MFYHGTSVALKVGDLLLPPETTKVIQERGRKKNLNKVFFTADFKSAIVYAGRAGNAIGGNKRYIYSVTPVGNLECINSTPGTSVFMATAAVITEVTILP
jgi:hypothetical protein